VDSGEVKVLRQEILDLKITKRAKDMFIERLQEERKALAEEQRGYVERMIGFSRQIGELRTKLLQLGSADDTRATAVLSERENSDFGIAAEDLGSEGGGSRARRIIGRGGKINQEPRPRWCRWLGPNVSPHGQLEEAPLNTGCLNHPSSGRT